MTLAEQWLEEGRQQGREEGRVQALRTIVGELLETKFGALSETQQSRIGAADEAGLRRLAQRCVMANSLDEIFA